MRLKSGFNIKQSTYRYGSIIKNVKNPVNKFDAVNKAYADRIKYKTATGNIPNTVMTDHILFTFPDAKAYTSGNIKIC